MSNGKALDPGLLEDCRKLAAACRIDDGASFRLRDQDPAATGTLRKADKAAAGDRLATLVEAIAALQDRLYAEDRWSLLVVLQAMDAAGKDGVIKHVFSGVNPQGCHVTPFKAPSAEELDHDFLWRCNRALPERGRIGVFNRSYYEEVLVVKVHPEILEAQRLPAARRGPKLWSERYRAIRHHERFLDDNGTLVRKVFLNVSRAEQKKRFLERIDDPAKNWKFAARDVKERGHWDEYMAAYEAAIRETATPAAPWFVVPADNKWFTRLVVAAIVVDALAGLDPRYPAAPAGRSEELEACRRSLLAEQD
jgi:PPK2 family polyphosphate:nucleotide phosphotransferase